MLFRLVGRNYGGRVFFRSMLPQQFFERIKKNWCGFMYSRVFLSTNFVACLFDICHFYMLYTSSMLIISESYHTDRPILMVWHAVPTDSSDATKAASVSTPMIMKHKNL